MIESPMNFFAGCVAILAMMLMVISMAKDKSYSDGCAAICFGLAAWVNFALATFG